jgi:MIP family channel proteins
VVYTRPQKLLAEVAGTFAFVLAAQGAACLDLYLRGTSRTPSGALAVAAAYGVTFGVCVAALGHISGGEFNPAITIARWVTHRLGPFDTLTFIAAQLAGAVAAAYALRMVFPFLTEYLHPPSLAAGTTRGPGMLIEGTTVFLLTLARFGAEVNRNRVRYWLSGILAGTVITCGVYFTMQYTGGALNPARAFGPAVASKQWTYQPVYWIGPVAGAVLAASIYDVIFSRKRANFPAPKPAI